MTLFEWYLARASGIVAFVLLTIAVVLGLTLSGRAKLPSWPRFAVEDVHRFAGLADGHVRLFARADTVRGLVRAFLVEAAGCPGTSSYRPLSTALGVVAAELLLALAITNRYRKRLSYRFWRRAHYLNFAVWGLALFHGIFAGTDRVALWADVLYGCSAAAVAGFVAWRATGGGVAAAGRNPANTDLAHAHGDPGRLEAGLLRGEEDRPRLVGRIVKRTTPSALVLRVSSLGSGAGHAHLRTLDPASSRVLDRDGDSPADSLAQAALGRQLHPRQQAQRLSRGVVAEVAVRSTPATRQ